MISSGMPRTNLAEIDQSPYVPAFPGVYGGILIDNAACGPIDDAYLVSSEAQFLGLYSPNNRIEVGYSNAYWSALAFLQKSDKLWVRRVVDTATCLYGGVKILKRGAGGSNAALSSGLVDPASYTFGSDETFILVGANPGLWNNSLAVAIFNYQDSPSVVKEVNAFVINIYKTTDLNNPLESWTCSKIVGTQDGFGNNIYIEDVLKGSSYIRAVDNPLITSPDVYPKEQQPTPLTFAQGFDGSTVTSGEMVTALSDLTNTDDKNLTVVMDGGYSIVAYQQSLIDLCDFTQGGRGDCFACLSVPYSDEAAANYLNEIKHFRNIDLNANTSFAALYTPHVKIYDKFNDRYLYVPPDGYAAGAISFTGSNYELWYPPAGDKRGVVTVLDLRRRYTTGEMGDLYDSGINPLRFTPGKGIRIWGQKTLLSRPSALNRINVRMLLIVIEPAIKSALDSFIFDLNTTEARIQVTAVINSYMDGIKARNGVYDYLCVCDATNNTPEDIDNYRLNVDLYIQPVKSIEYINFRVIITRTGVQFRTA